MENQEVKESVPSAGKELKSQKERVLRDNLSKNIATAANGAVTGVVTRTFKYKGKYVTEKLRKTEKESFTKLAKHMTTKHVQDMSGRDFERMGCASELRAMIQKLISEESNVAGLRYKSKTKAAYGEMAGKEEGLKPAVLKIIRDDMVHYLFREKRILNTAEAVLLQRKGDHTAAITEMLLLIQKSENVAKKAELNAR